MSTTVDLVALDLVRRLSTLLARGADSRALVDCLAELLRPYGVAVSVEAAPAPVPRGDGVARAALPLGSGLLVFGSPARAAFDRAELDVLTMAADLVSAAVAREQQQAALASALADRSEAEARRQHLETALVTNRTIAMAIGIVMARTGTTEDEAHRWLTERSQRSNRKVRDLAERIVLTGSLEP